MKKVLIDTNIILDIILQRYPFFEDAIQYCVADMNKMDMIVTRNKSDFIHSTIEVYTPNELLKHKK